MSTCLDVCIVIIQNHFQMRSLSLKEVLKLQNLTKFLHDCNNLYNEEKIGEKKTITTSN